MAKIAVIGGGAAGMLAAGRAAQRGHEVHLFEKNNRLGKKILITGKGRCNVTNDGDLDAFLDNIPGNPYFMYSAFYRFDNQALRQLLLDMGLETKVERGNRVFPVTDRSLDVVQALEKYMRQNKVALHLESQVEHVVMKEGKVTEADIDKACRRILEAKYKLGLFANPYKYCDVKRAEKEVFTPEHRSIARQIATETFVLLKNQDNLLPLQRKGNIALIGPLANTRANMPGTWSVAATADKYSTLLEGFKNSVGSKANILYAQGSNLMYDADYQTRATMFGRELPRGNDQELLDEALKVAAQADVIVAALGESSEMSGESSSRSELEMPDAQRHLLEALLKTGKPVVLVLFSGRPVVLTWENENVPAILNVWFGGSEAADAIADVVFGDVCPSGKLTTTFPQNVGQLPMAYNHKNTGRPLKEGKWFEKFRSNYLDVSNDPLYPFGYGLSYTTFQYSDITLSSKQLNADGKLTASVTVTNTGNYDADEIVQLYIRDLVGSITRPVKELKGFERIHLKKGESKQVTFTITPELLKFYNYDIQYVYEPGEFHVMIGPNSRDVKTTSFELK